MTTAALKIRNVLLILNAGLKCHEVRHYLSKVD